MRLKIRAVVALAALQLAMDLPGADLRAQAVVGDIVDGTRSAVAEAVVGVFDATGRFVAQGRSNENGRFRIDVPGPGAYRLHVNRLGYRSLSGGPYDLVAGVELELFVVMHRAPVPLDSIAVEVEGRSSRLRLAGFYERREAGFGYFFDREEIGIRAGRGVTEMLSRIPGVSKTPPSTLIGLDAVAHPPLQYRQGSRACVPSLFVDGNLVRPGGSFAAPLRPDDWFAPSEIEGMEFYGGPAGVPTRFAQAASCAVLVVWTRGAGGR